MKNSNNNSINIPNKSCRILGINKYVDNNSHVTQLNNNDLIIGPSGAGKTRGYVLPNIMQCNESFIVSDTKNSLYAQTSEMLKKAGYVVERIDFSGVSESTIGYNPFDSIKYDKAANKYSERDILTFAEIITPIESEKDSFWDIAAKHIIASMIAYVLEELPEEEHNLISISKLFYAPKNAYAQLLKELEYSNPDSLAIKNYSLMKCCKDAEKMSASISGIVAEKVTPFLFDGPAKQYQMRKRIKFEDISKRKTAVFLNVSDLDSTTDRIITLFYAQALQSLCYVADCNPNRHLNVPVRIIMDDFAASAVIPNFDKIISVIRSRHISVSPIIQSLSQLQSMYSSEKAKTIINNCDHLLYLGGQDIDTAQMISMKAGKTLSSIIDMPINQVILFERGKKAQFMNKYDVSMHPSYNQIPESSAYVNNNVKQESMIISDEKAPSPY